MRLSSRFLQRFFSSSLSLSSPHRLSVTTTHPQTYTNLLLQQCSKAVCLAQIPFDKIPHNSIFLRNCRKVHARILVSGFKLVGNLGTALVDLYAKNGDLDSAQNTFVCLEERTRSAWSSIAYANSRLGLLDNVIDLFVEMHKSGCQFDQHGFAIVLTSLAKLGKLDYGKIVHCQTIKQGLDSTSFCEGSLINMYVKCSSISDARRVFDGIKRADKISWTTMIDGYVCIGKSKEALELFSRMEGLGIKLDSIASVSVINAFVNLGMLENARDMCRQMPYANVIAWNSIISGHVKNGYDVEAVELFQEMRSFNVKPTRSTLGSVLSAIASMFAIVLGRLVHSEAIRLGLGSSVFVVSSLINMYAKCHIVHDARKVFDYTIERNTVMWNSIIGGYLRNEHAEDAIDMFLVMRIHNYEIDEVTLVNLFGACALLENLELGRQLHCIMIKYHYEGSLFLKNALIDLYAKCRDINSTKKQFEMIDNKDSISWNAVISAYAYNGREEKSMRLFKRMMAEGITPDMVTFATVLSACSNTQAFYVGTQLHCLAIKYNSCLGSYVVSSLIDMYGKVGEVKDASKIYNEIHEPTVVARNTLISCYIKYNREQEALALFQEMQIEGIEPSPFTYASILPFCDSPAELHMGKQIHSKLLKSGILYGYDFLEVSLLSMYLKSNSVDDATILFLELPRKNNIVLWTTVISGYTQNGYNEDALILYWKMRDYGFHLDESTFSSILKTCASLASLRDGKEIHSLILRTGFSSYRYTCSALIDMYSKCGNISDAFHVFQATKNKEDVILYNPMIVGFGKNGFAEEALTLFHRMKESMKLIPDDVTFLGVLTACSHAGLFSAGRGFFSLMSKKYGIIPRNDHYACMIDLLCRGGFMEQAEKFINDLQFEPDGVIWATFLSACRIHGDSIRGKHAAQKLISLEPASSSPYVLLSNIYASSGNWKEAKELRHMMRGQGVRKSPGCSWIEVGRTTCSFVAEDKLHPRASHIYKILGHLNMEMKEEGYSADCNLVSLDEEYI